MRLIAIDDVMIRDVRDGVLERTAALRLGACAELVGDAVRQTAGMLARVPRELQFGGYLVVDESDSVVGTCGFRTGPSAEGEIEIAYFTFPPYEGLGYATQMAAELTRIALASSSVRRVVAHTLPERNASTRVLEKVGMRLFGPVEDPEDGIVWRWQIDGAAEQRDAADKRR
jgi:ribosomal-protein-alanine N-acetyltransferase